ncbi:MAG: N-acetylglucosamine-6-phosphate deacetylase [bacterium]
MTANYIDLQVNGFAGVDFNADGVSTPDIRRACEAMKLGGVSSFLATITTEFLPNMCGRIRRIIDARNEDSFIASIITGIHVEGPFISPIHGYVGAHPVDGVVIPNIEDAAKLINAGDGLVKLITLAPECDENSTITRYLVNAGIRVAAGHTDASIDQLKAACDAGLSLFSHLGNGCPATMHRHDNIVQRALSLRNYLQYTFITDGAHIPFFALRNYIDLVGIDRAIIVTDAMSAAGLGPGRYRIGRMEVEVGEDQVARQPGSTLLAGAAVTMQQAAENLKEKLGFSHEEIQEMTSVNPEKYVN